jgi:hypothetical protein
VPLMSHFLWAVRVTLSDLHTEIASRTEFRVWVLGLGVYGALEPPFSCEAREQGRAQWQVAGRGGGKEGSTHGSRCPGTRCSMGCCAHIGDRRRCSCCTPRNCTRASQTGPAKPDEPPHESTSPPAGIARDRPMAHHHALRTHSTCMTIERSPSSAIGKQASSACLGKVRGLCERPYVKHGEQWEGCDGWRVRK